MEKGKTKFLVPLVALCVLLVGASSAFGQAVTYQITSTPTFVINTGRAEVLGAVRITAQNSVTSIATTAEFLFENTGCDNDATSGIMLNIQGFVTAAIASVTNLSAGCVVSVTIPSTANAVGDFVEVAGVRGRVDLSPAGAPSVGVDISARLNATPSGSSLFTAPSIVRVATSQVPLTVTVSGGSALFCVGGGAIAPIPSILVVEGFNGALVDHLTPPTTPRPLAGGTNNSQIQVVVMNIPAGVTLMFPPTVTAEDSAALTAVSAGGGLLTLLTSTVTGTTQTVVYDYSAVDQGLSDITLERFSIGLDPTTSSDAAIVVTLPAALVLGSATAQVQMWPGLASEAPAVVVVTDPPQPAAAKPRFNDPLIPTPGGALVTVNPCTTNLLFSWAPNIAGFDTGIAIANTSMDALAFPGLTTPTVAQPGTCTLHGWTADTATYVAYTTPTIGAGTTFVTTLSSETNPAYNGFFGYIIAVCNFQFAHGFAFINDGFGQAPSQAQGYLALVIPNPFVTAGTRYATGGCDPTIDLNGTLAGVQTDCTANAGEGLGQ